TAGSGWRGAVSGLASVSRAAAWLMSAPPRRSATLVPSGPWAIGSVRAARLRHALCLVVLDQGLDQPVEIAPQQAGKVVHREPDAVVGHAVIGEVVGPNLLRALSTPDL